MTPDGKNPLVVGVTGGSGSGKSTLSRALERRGFLFLDCDVIYHELLSTDEALLRAIENRFPGVVIGGALDRKKLGGIVFGDKVALLELNAITHAAVKREVLARLEGCGGRAVIDAIALLESGLGALCDVTIAVTAPEELRLGRLMARDGITEAYARQRIAAQKPDSYFISHCDLAVHNHFRTEEDFLEYAEDFLNSHGFLQAN